MNLKDNKVLKIILISLIFFIPIGGGATYYLLSKKYSDESAASEKKIEEFKKKIEEDIKEGKEKEDKGKKASVPEDEVVEEVCPSFTAEELTLLETYSTFTNEEQGYTFKYPADWVINTDEANFVTLNNAPDTELMLQVRSDEMNAIGFVEFTNVINTVEIPECLDIDPVKMEPTGGGSFNLAANIPDGDEKHLFLFSYMNDETEDAQESIIELIFKTLEFS